MKARIAEVERLLGLYKESKSTRMDRILAKRLRVAVDTLVDEAITKDAKTLTANPVKPKIR